MPENLKQDDLLINSEAVDDLTKTEKINQGEKNENSQEIKELNQRIKVQEGVEIAYKKALLRFRDEMKGGEVAQQLKKVKPERKIPGTGVKISSIEEEINLLKKRNPFAKLGTGIKVGINRLKSVQNPEEVVALESFIERNIHGYKLDTKTDKFVEAPYRLSNKAKQKLSSLFGGVYDPVLTITKLQELGVSIDSYTFELNDLSSLRWFSDSEGVFDVLDKARAAGFVIPQKLNHDHSSGTYIYDAMQNVMGSPETIESLNKNGEKFAVFLGRTGIPLELSAESVKVLEKVSGEEDIVDFCLQYSDKFDKYHLPKNIILLENLKTLSDKGVLCDLNKLGQVIHMDSALYDIFYYGPGPEMDKFCQRISELGKLVDSEENFENLRVLSQGFYKQKFYLTHIEENIGDILDIKSSLKEVIGYIEVMRELGNENMLENQGHIISILKIAHKIQDEPEFRQFIFDPDLKIFAKIFNQVNGIHTNKDLDLLQTSYERYWETLKKLTPDEQIGMLCIQNMEEGRYDFLNSKENYRLFFASLRSLIQKHPKKEFLLRRCKRLEESFLIAEDSENLSPAVQEKKDVFKNKFGIKGERLVSLAIVAYGLEDEEQFIKKLEDIENVLDLYKEDQIPEGMRVTFGMEYEVGNSIVKEFEGIVSVGYKNEIEIGNRAAGISSAASMPHEIATKPTDNPYILLAGMKLLQDAGCLALSFKKYRNAPRGYRLN